MQRITKFFSRQPNLSVLFLSLLMLVRAAVQIFLYKSGFISVAADEINRGIRAAQWAANPQFNLIKDVQDVWLPFEKYLNGLALMIWPDVIKAPRATIFLASCIVLVAWFGLIYRLFKNFPTAALATLFTAFLPWFVWLSGTPMLEMYYFAGFFAGLYFLVVWLQEDRKGYWALAGLCFLLASGFHYQSWTFINVVNLVSLVFFFTYLSRRQYRRCLQLVGFYFLGNALVVSFTAIDYFDTGKLFNFLANHTTYSKWVYSGYNVPVLEKLKYYPQLAFENASLWFWILALLSCLLLLIRRDAFEKWIPLLVGGLAIAINSVMNVFSVPATAAPGRYCIFYVMMATPYLADGLVQIWQSGRLVKFPWARVLTGVLAAALCAVTLWWGVSRIKTYQNATSIAALDVGRAINQLMPAARPGETAQPKYMIQLLYWDFLTVELTAGHYDAVVFDRELDYYDRNKPSVFTQNASVVYQTLNDENIKVIALQDAALKETVKTMSFMKEEKSLWDWTIYRFVP